MNTSQKEYIITECDSGQLLIRPSGTEPVLRTYAESKTREEAFSLLEAVEKELLNK